MDSHAYQGYVVPPHYDSMIGKLIVWAENRERAIAKMKQALSELTIEGISCTKTFHQKMMENPDFINNDFDTNYLSGH
jgi:acetyl-CoA carboxylase biotin carboxylase subunit